MMDFWMEILAPIVLMVAFILLIIIFVYSIWDFCSRVKNLRNNKYICDEYKEDEDSDNEDIYAVERAIIVIGNEKIEVDIDYYDIDDTTVEIGSKDGKVYITDIKNVLLISEKFNEDGKND
ncbi:hypothetical protein NSA50_16775 [Clostridium sp. DSM 100503]|uniref:hypothetical protein n=1 Tax=Clostridium sp. DSM 100503 TaxID=2963282 RepID=UPI00214A1AA4|nr:hypothetical protein [Clostridium sp. DSM 100503]MCR1952681.1 hypothetical protein [Clostridium sp. DSM 100503]